MKSGTNCPNCQRTVQGVDGLCPLCGTSLPRQIRPVPEDLLGPVDTDPNGVIPAEIADEDTDPGAAPTHDEYEEDEFSDDEDEFEPGDEIEAPGAEIADTDSPRSPTLPAGDVSPAGRFTEVDAGDENAPEKEDERLPRLPWGKAIMVLVYLLVGGTCMLHEHVSSEGAKVERHLRAADDLLGERMGSTSETEDLIEAAEHYLQALAVDMHLELAHRRLDLINRRLEERRASLPDAMARSHAAISSRAQLEKAQARKSFWSELPVTPTERFGLGDHRKRMRRNSYIFFGGLGLLISWMVISGSMRRLGTRETRGPNEPDPKDSYLP